MDILSAISFSLSTRAETASLDIEMKPEGKYL